ncbi:MAG: nitroreductase family protein [Anaerolineaceae bacterium]|nr:nitroreductase family protein [Anaerolineaceae bacterium]
MMSFDYTDHSEENLFRMDPAPLRSLIRYKAHKTIEIQLYNAIVKGKKLSADIGQGVRMMLNIWKKRGLPMESPDFQWIDHLYEAVEQVKEGRQPELFGNARDFFSDDDLESVRNLFYQRRSIRHFTEEEVPDWMVDEIIKAGLWAAQGGNLGNTRFLVIRESNEPGLLIGGDIPSGSVHIVVCQDTRAYKVIPTYAKFEETYKTNQNLDCGAAMQNMVLMAHALGLGAAWLTFNNQKMKGKLRDRFQLEDHIVIMNYIDIGFPNSQPIPRGRHNVDEVIIGRV